MVLGRGFRLSLDFFSRGLYKRTVVARLPLRQLGFLVTLKFAFAVYTDDDVLVELYRRDVIVSVSMAMSSDSTVAHVLPPADRKSAVLSATRSGLFRKFEV